MRVTSSRRAVHWARRVRDSTSAGMLPDDVAALVFEAVRSGHFYIPTKPSYQAQIASRHEAMTRYVLPPSASLD